MPGTTSTALLSFSYDQHHETDAAKRKGVGMDKTTMLKEQAIIQLKTFNCGYTPP